ncbi:CYCA1-1 [Linum grandiflorum]
MESFGQPFCSSTASSPSKLNTAALSENATATAPAPPKTKMTTSLGRKRPPLGDITNDRRNRSKTSLPSSSLEENSTKSSKLKSNAVASVVSSKSGGVSVSIDESVEVTEDVFTSRDAVGVVDIDTDDEIVNLDANSEDPQLCVTIACDIYKHLRESETRRRPATDFMERIQTDINANMRAILIDWLVEVVEEYRLVPDTLYLTVNYIDRYLSGNVIKRQRLQLLGVACLMIAAKYEEICAPRAEVFCYITDNTYNKDEVTKFRNSLMLYVLARVMKNR